MLDWVIQEKNYVGTRHNIGFAVAEQLLKDFKPVDDTTWDDNKKLKSSIVQIEWKPKKGELEQVIIAKPKTYMNNSGMAVKLIADFYKIKPEDIWVVYDELDLPVGSMKIRKGGSGAGHHGIESIIEHVGDDKFWRFRLGIGVVRNKGELGNQRIHDAEKHVLGTFQRGELGKIRELIKHGAKALELGLEKGLPAAMNRYNTK